MSCLPCSRNGRTLLDASDLRMEEIGLISFVSGGARSGKSAFAESCALQLHDQSTRKVPSAQCVYLATCPVSTSDEEMQKRIRRHQQDRELERWHTIEEPLYIHEVLLSHRSGDVILLDCLTLWLNTALFEGKMDEQACIRYIQRCLQIVLQRQLYLVIVSNDVNEDVPIRNPLVQSYIRILQRLHQQIVQHANEAVQVIAGVPIWRKGERG